MRDEEREQGKERSDGRVNDERESEGNKTKIGVVREVKKLINK